MKKVILLLGIFTFCQFSFAQTATAVQQISVSNTSEMSADEQAVHAAILDYVEGIYSVDSTRIERSVHPDLRKRGYWFSKKDSEYKNNLDMTFDELVHLSATWNKSGKRANENSVKKIEIYEVTDKTASAKLTAAWGMDYFHLAKLNGRWYIMNVLWQSIVQEEQ